MKSTLRILLLISSILFLSACGSEDEELEILGNWEIKARESEGYQSFSETEAIAYTKHLTNDCFNIEKTNLLTLTPSTFSITSTQDQVLNFKWSITSDSLTITSSSIQTYFLYSRTQKNLNNLEICKAPIEEIPDEEIPDEETPIEELPTEEEPLPIVGSWQSEHGFYLLINNTTITTAIYDDHFQCHSKGDLAISSLNDSSFILDENNHTLDYTISEGTLILSETSDNFTPTDFKEADIISCEDPTAEGSITITLGFADLPETISLTPNNAQVSSWIYGVEIMFDVDDSEGISDGDLSFNAEHNQEVSANDDSIALTDIDHSIFHIYETEVNASGQIQSWAANSITKPKYTVDNIANTITFFILKRSHKALRSITSETNLKVNVFYQDINSDRQTDQYPSSGYTQSQDTSELSDEVGDVSGNYSTDTIVDLTNISLTVTE